MTALWCGNVLRMVTPQLWLGRNLIDQVNRAALERVAQVSETNGVHKIVLRPAARSTSWNWLYCPFSRLKAREYRWCDRDGNRGRASPDESHA